MKIALIFSKPISFIIAKAFCKTLNQSDSSNVKAIYMKDGIFCYWTPSGGDDAHCFGFAKRNNFTPIYITIL